MLHCGTYDACVTGTTSHDLNKMANRQGDLMDLSGLKGPLGDLEAMRTHKMAVERDYISQPRLSKYDLIP